MLPCFSVAQPPGVRCFKVVTSNSDSWRIGYQFCFSVTEGTDSLYLSGFTNHHADVYGFLKVLFYDNDWPSLEIFYAPSGAMIWYCTYNEDGKVMKEGNSFSEMMILENSK
ncbi:MAG TPA: hypothetical protein PL009_07720 [Flavipsychrobacter sp.]|nr:hypothetical protein [Flavipsychrobacter sp.]